MSSTTRQIRHIYDAVDGSEDHEESRDEEEHTEAVNDNASKYTDSVGGGYHRDSIEGLGGRGSEDTGDVGVKAAAGTEESQHVEGGTPASLMTVMSMLLDRVPGSDLELEDTRGNTALHLACWSGSTVFVKLLYEHGASFDSQNHKGEYPLDALIMSRYMEVLQYALDAGVDPNLRSVGEKLMTEDICKSLKIAEAVYDVTYILK
jgi:hypothetical protein